MSKIERSTETKRTIVSGTVTLSVKDANAIVRAIDSLPHAPEGIRGSEAQVGAQIMLNNILYTMASAILNEEPAEDLKHLEQSMLDAKEECMNGHK